MADLILTKVANETKVITSVEEDHIAIKNVGDTQVQLVTKSNPLYVALDSRPASGPAGGDLTGAYPDPTLAAIGTAGTYTKVTTDSKGRITFGTNATAADVGALSATDSINIGTTSISVNRSSASQSLTGISIDGNAGTVTNGAYINAANTFTAGPQTIFPVTDVKGIVIKASASQTVNLLEIQPNGSTTPIAKVDASGNFTANTIAVTDRATTRTNLSLGNVDNTSDVNKPISNATQTALNTKADFNIAVALSVAL